MPKKPLYKLNAKQLEVAITKEANRLKTLGKQKLSQSVEKQNNFAGETLKDL